MDSDSIQNKQQPVQKLDENSLPSSPVPQQKKSREKPLFLLVIALLIICGLLAFLLYFYTKTKQSGEQSQASVSTSPTSAPSPLPTTDDTGQISWLPVPQQISATGVWSVIPDSLANASSSAQFTKAPVIYKVGTWTNGMYKGNDLVDIVYTSASEMSANAYESVIRATEYKNKPVFFGLSSYDEQRQYLRNDTPAHDVLSDPSHIPGLLNPSQDNETIIYNTNQITLDLYTSSPPFFSPNGYTFLTTFGKGQKLYRKDQSGNSVSLSQLEDAYKVEDLDHTAFNVDNEPGSQISYYSKTPVQWVTQPDLLSDLGKDNTQTIGDIGYDSYFLLSCKNTPAEQIDPTAVFNSQDITLVATSGSNRYYQPTNMDSMLQKMYALIQQAGKDDTSIAVPSYDRYVKSMPLLIWKDAFGTYQLLFRWKDYPGFEGGCGEPVIYLYPQKATPVSVQFASPMALTQSVPSYGNRWNVIAQPSGELTDLNTNKNYSYLYWEGGSENALPPLSQGTVVAKNEVKTYLEKTLTTYGLNTNEQKDFMDFWLPKMQEKPYYKISFYTTDTINQAIPLHIYPQPNTLFRILMKFHGLDQIESSVPQPAPTPFVRNGFTVVEWGGIFSQ